VKPSRTIDAVAAPPAGAAALAIAGLAKAFPGQPPILRGVDLAVHAGECVALLGANGSGKSTLLRCALRLIEPDAGRITLLDAELSVARGRALRRLRSRVGLVFQRHNLVPRLSVLSNVVHGALGRTGRAAHQAIAPRALREEAIACLERVNLADLAGRRADRLSGGQSQRVAIARALMQRPGLILADEPAASLDPAAGEEVMALFGTLARTERLAVLFTSHDLPQALAHADRLLGLRGGVIEVAGPTQDFAIRDLAALYA
jgi:phosphonate transport system ATP-binding protein